MANVTKLTTKTDSAGKPLIHADADDGKSYEWPASDVSTAPGPTPLPPPANLVAHWNGSGGTVDLSWNAVQNAGSYPLYRGTDPNNMPQLNEASGGATTWADHVSQTSQDQTLYYSVATRSTDGVTVGSKSATVSVVVPASGGPIPPTPTQPSGPVPTNLKVKGMGNKTDQLSWDAAKGAAKYNVYADDRLLATTQNPTYTVPSQQFVDSKFYTVTAVDPAGMESLACPPCLAQGSASAWGGNPGEGAPTGAARGEWNSGAGRIVFEWHWTGGKTSYWGNQFRVYRDGQMVADCMDTFYYIDNNPGGGSHSYQVSVLAKGAEGPKSSSVSASAPPSAPAGGGHMLIQSVDQNHNSVRVHFAAYPGALDYRCSIQGKTDHYKYAGVGGLAIEWNGIDPNAPMPNLIIEALDKLGPFQAMEGSQGASDPFVSKATRPMPMGMVQHTNGQGDPSNVPIPIAVSSPTPVVLKPKTLSGAQAFLDNFDAFLPLKQIAPIDPIIWKHDPFVSGSRPNDASNPYIKEFQNNNWRMRMYICNAQDTKLFGMGRHMMDTLYDGGVPGGGPEHDSTPPHNNNASTTFEPLVNGLPIAFDFSGKVLHLTMEVDSHFTPRRWCDMGIYRAGDSLVNPAIRKLNTGAKEAPTQQGDALTWEIQAGLVNLTQCIGDGSNSAKVSSYHDAIDQSYPGDHQSAAARDQGNPPTNGSQANLDLRRTFDMYTDGKRVVIVEGGKKLADKTLAVALAYTKANVYFAHHAYHLVNERSECARRGNEPYYTNYVPAYDKRHWNSMGAEVLNSWPNIP